MVFITSVNFVRYENLSKGGVKKFNKFLDIEKVV